MSTVQVFRPKANLVWGYSALALDALFVTQFLAYPSGGENIALDALLATLVATASVLIWLRPKLELRESGLTVVNPLRTVIIEYGDITDIETKWALLIKHQGKNTRVWVAPSNGKQRWITDSTNRWRFSKIPNSKTQGGESVPISSSNLSDSGAAATLIRQRMHERH